MRTKRIADRLAFVFLITMLLLTLFAEDIQRQTFPAAAGEQLQKRDFPFTFTLEDGTQIEASTPRNAVPARLLNGNELWVLAESQEQEGVYILESVTAELGETADGYVEIISGISGRQLIFLGSDRETAPGDRVLLAGDGSQGQELSETACAVVSVEEVPEKGASGNADIFPSFATVREAEGEYWFYAPKGLERVVYYELTRRLPGAAVRSPYLDKIHGRNAAAVGGTAAVTVLLLTGCFALRKRRFYWLRACALGGWLVAAGAVLRQLLVPPMG